MIRSSSSWMAAAMLAAIGLAPATAQDVGSRQTREFLQAAAQSDQFEILESTTAVTQAESADVRAFAKQMIKDHTATSQALQQAATQAGLKPPVMNVSADQGQMLNALQGVTGAKFDQLYIRQQALAHRAALVTEQAYEASGDTPAVRQAATAATPIIAAHLQMAEQMSANLGGS